MNAAARSDFADLYDRFEKLPKGMQAELRRVSKPDELQDRPGLYRLFPNERPSPQQIRLAFILAWCPNRETRESLGGICADEIGEQRIMQVVRASAPDDLIALRRIVIQISRRIGWMSFERYLPRWNKRAKRELVQDYYIALHKLDQGDK